MKIGDIVVITESFGGGLPYIGSVGKIVELNNYLEGGQCYNAIVLTKGMSFICNCTPATDLLKALF